MKAAMVGWAHSPFGKHEGKDAEDLLQLVAREALSDAGIGPDQVAGVVLGWYNGGLHPQDFGSSLVLNILPELRFSPSFRVENACATGSAAIHQAALACESRAYREDNSKSATKSAPYWLVLGVEKMTDTPGEEVGRILRQASYLREESEIEAGFAGVFARIAQGYFQKYGDQSDALARIAAKNHRNGCDNPYAQLHKDLGYEFCRTESPKNPMVAAPLKRTDCSLVSDGAAAAVLCDGATALGHDKAVALRGRAHCNDFLPMSKRDMTFLDGCAKAWHQALEDGGVTLDDLDLVETHDCFTIAELMQYEAMGLADRGQGWRVLAEGQVEADGPLPVNRSGGLKSKGHPIGATGVSMHVLTAMQLTGRAGDMQIKNARLGGIFNMGGAGVANYCTILESLS